MRLSNQILRGPDIAHLVYEKDLAQRRPFWIAHGLHYVDSAKSLWLGGLKDGT